MCILFCCIFGYKESVNPRSIIRHFFPGILSLRICFESLYYLYQILQVSFVHFKRDISPCCIVSTYAYYSSWNDFPIGRMSHQRQLPLLLLHTVSLVSGLVWILSLNSRGPLSSCVGPWLALGHQQGLKQPANPHITGVALSNDGGRTRASDVCHHQMPQWSPQFNA